MDVVVTYEGGGARGIWHLGALRILEQSHTWHASGDPAKTGLPRYRVLGVNGTSIGAMVAALHAVGYSADQMLDLRPETAELPGPGSIARLLTFLRLRERVAEGSTVLQNAGIVNLIQLFNRRQRLAIWFMSAFKSKHVFIRWPVRLLMVCAPLLPVPFFYGIMWLYRGGVEHQALAMAAALALTLLLFASAVRSVVKGLGSAEILADRLDLCLAAVVRNYSAMTIKAHHRAIEKGGYERTITFAHLSDYTLKTKNGHPPPPGFANPISLAMIASNISTGRLEKFSNNNTPNAIIAEAVAASCAMPILFEPFRISKVAQSATGVTEVEQFYVDGAITSNMPVWTSDMARAVNPNLISMSFGTISDKLFPLNNIANRISAFVNTAMFGSGPLETRRTRNAWFKYEPNEDDPVGLLDFDMNYARAKTEIDDVGYALQSQIEIRAQRRAVHSQAARALAIGLASLTPAGHPVRTGSANTGRPNIRVTLLRPVTFGQDGLRKYHTYSSNPMSKFVDDEMTFDGTHSLPGAAWKDPDPARRLQISDMMQGTRFDSRGLMWRPGTDDLLSSRLAVDPRLDHCCWETKWAMSRRLNLEPFDPPVGPQFQLRNPAWLVVLVESDIEIKAIACGLDKALATDRGVDIEQMRTKERLLKLFDDYELEIGKRSNVKRAQSPAKQLVDYAESEKRKKVSAKK